MQVYFKEKQWFRQWWLIALTLLLFIYWSYSIVYLFYFRVPFAGMQPGVFNLALVIIPALSLLLIFSFLKTEIREDGFTFQLFPLQFNNYKIKWDEVEHIYLREWSYKEFFRPSIKQKFKMNAYTMMGNKGVQINLKNGRKFLFSTQKPEELTEALSKILLH